jgi:hypothetical protein
MRIIDITVKNIKSFFVHKRIGIILYGFLLLLLFSLSFMAGILYERFSLSRATDMVITEHSGLQQLWEQVQQDHLNNALYYGSKNGSTFYPLDCTAGSRIHDENKIYFFSRDDAYDAGYTESQRCTY